MNHRLLMFLFASAFLAVVNMRSQAAATQMPPGVVLAAKVTGTVTLTVAGTMTALNFNDKVPHTAKINTGPDSTAVLVFSNGATVQVGPDTELILQRFLQDPFGGTIRVAELVEEPTPSRATLALNRGELVGNVKRLKLDYGSSFVVMTAAGVADIGCGTFRIVFGTMADGQALLTLANTGCEVGFTSRAAGGSVKTSEEKRLAVRPGQEIKVTLATNAEKQVGPELVTKITAIPPATLKRITTVTAENLVAVGGNRHDAQQNSGLSDARPMRARPHVGKKKAGSTNIGNIAYDAKWNSYGAYLQRLIDTVQIQWERILIERRVFPPSGGTVTVKFIIDSEGRIAEILDVQNHSTESAAAACVSGITNRAPYGPWTSEMQAMLGNRQQMTFTFYYR